MNLYPSISEAIFAIDAEAKRAEIDGRRQYAAGLRNASHMLVNSWIGPDLKSAVPLDECSPPKTVDAS